MEGKSGLSLLEVLIVIAIIAILAAVSAPMFRNFVGNVQIESTGKQIISDLKNMRAKSIAGEDGYRWGIHFVNSTNDYYETFSTSPGGTGYGDASTVVKSTVYLPGGITLSDPAETGTKDFIFSRVSGGLSATTTLTIVSADRSKTVTGTAVGNVY